ncbi:MAG: extracellular solute-binding protein [Gammaproteobacteria bacterium]|nr:extracellular solute-binding protein [Gammaproteobacteria bacterium]
MVFARKGILLLGCFLFPVMALAQSTLIRSHAIAMHGEPKYAADFPYFDYVNPDAPKGGMIRQGARGTFDSFNPWIDKGTPVSPGSIETLTVQSRDEAFTRYCLLCEEMVYPEDRSWIIFYLREQARWHDGRPVTPDDVVWSFNTLLEKGQTFYHFYYADVEEVQAIENNGVRFQFKNTGNRELPLILGDLPILPKHYWEREENDIAKTTLTPPLGSGPYRIEAFDAGRFYTLERVEDYWGRDLPVNAGIHNFNARRVDFFRDRIPIRLALKAGDIDYYYENTAKSWATEFDIPAVQSGWLVKETVEHSAPQGMQAYVMNLRRDKFQDPHVRQAISLAFDFEWTNQNIFYHQYTRSKSFFSNSELASSGIPEGDELAVLEEYRDQLPEALFTRPFVVPETDGSGWSRENLRKALALIDESPWMIREGKLENPQGRKLTIEFLLYSSSFERLVLPYVANLKRIGIDMKVRIVDTGQYVNRLRAFDFDMIVGGWGQSETPGNEQRDYWSCAAAKRPGSRNTAGLCHPVVDALVERLIVSRTRKELIAVTRALDRVLLWQNFMVPNWHLPANRILWWDKFERPETPLRNGVDLSRWWVSEAKAEQLAEAREKGEINQRGGDAEKDARNRPRGWKLVLLVGILAAGGYAMNRAMKRKAA